MSPDERATFIATHTRVHAPPLCPELRLHLADEAVALWQLTEDELEAKGLPPPFWAFAWAGGQALARHVLDHPAIVAGRRVLDVASGSGLVAIAAMKAGAARATASEIDAFALTAIGLNAALNDVGIDVHDGDLIGTEVEADVLLVGDLFYDRDIADRLFAWLKREAARGVEVLVGDPGRTYLPREGLVEVARHAVAVSRDLEDAEIKNGRVFRLAVEP